MCVFRVLQLFWWKTWTCTCWTPAKTRYGKIFYYSSKSSVNTCCLCVEWFIDQGCVCMSSQFSFVAFRFIFELCQPIQVKQLDIANFEIFSSNPRDFLVSISDRWTHSFIHSCSVFTFSFAYYLLYNIFFLVLESDSWYHHRNRFSLYHSTTKLC